MHVVVKRPRGGASVAADSLQGGQEEPADVADAGTHLCKPKRLRPASCGFLSSVHNKIVRKQTSNLLGEPGGAPSVKRPTSAQVVISRSVSSSPASGSVLTARSLEAASDSVSPSLSARTPAHALSL